MRLIRADNLIVADDDRGKSMNAKIPQQLPRIGNGRATPSEVVESAFKTTLDARKAIRGGTS